MNLGSTSLRQDRSAINLKRLVLRSKASFLRGDSSRSSDAQLQGPALFETRGSQSKLWTIFQASGHSQVKAVMPREARRPARLPAEGATASAGKHFDRSGYVGSKRIVLQLTLSNN